MEMHIEKRNELDEEVEKFTSRWSQSLVDLISPSYLKQKNLRTLFMRHKQIIYSIFHSNMVIFC